MPEDISRRAPIPVLIGGRLVRDFANPVPGDVDLWFMERRLDSIVRFTGHLAALNVSEHQKLCGHIARRMKMADRVIEWAEHHDDHEYATGDLVTPLALAIQPLALDSVKAAWDTAICGARGIEPPNDEIRRQVDLVDKIALAVEWRHCLGRDIGELGVRHKVWKESADPAILDRVLTDRRRGDIAWGRAALSGAPVPIDGERV